MTYRCDGFSFLILQNEGIVETAYEMVVVSLAVRADYHVGILGVEIQAPGDVDYSPTAALARKTFLAAGYGSEDVIGVHGANDQVAAVPRTLAGHTFHFVTALQAAQASSVKELETTLPDHLDGCFIIRLW